MFYQADLFATVHGPTVAQVPPVSLPQLIQRVSQVSRRPRYVLLILNLIAKAADDAGRLGPYVQVGPQRIPVRDWLTMTLAPLANRDCRRMAMIAAVRSEVTTDKVAAGGVDALARQEEEIAARILRSGRTNVSRAVSDLVRAGLLQRHYQGWRVDHRNRGAQREAVYTITPDVRHALVVNG